MRHVPSSRVTRRTTIVGALAGTAALAGCEADRRDDGPAGRSAPAAGTDPDAALVATVTAELDELVALVAAAAARRPVLARDLAAFSALHQAHRATLPEGDTAPPRPRVTGTPRDVATQLLRREEQARRRLADWALDAESGALARLLASMSAGVAVHLADTGLRGAGS